MYKKGEKEMSEGIHLWCFGKSEEEKCKWCRGKLK